MSEAEWALYGRIIDAIEHFRELAGTAAPFVVVLPLPFEHMPGIKRVEDAVGVPILVGVGHEGITIGARP
jgi:hypothetical protein